MSSRRPLRTVQLPPSAPSATATVLVTWQDGAAHVWGWDGHSPMSTGWLDRTTRADRFGSTGPLGRFDSFDLDLPDGRRLRPPSIRLSSTALVSWLAVAGHPDDASDAVRWLTAVADLAAAGVRRGHVSPIVRVEQDRTVARWMPLADATTEDALAELTTAAPPIVLGTGADTAQVHAALVDALARQRLAAAWWSPDLPARRSPRGAATRAVFVALSRPDPLVDVRADPTIVQAIAASLDRRRRRADGEPVVVPRLRLDVPDELDERWQVRLELLDELDSGRWCSAHDVWEQTPLALELAGGPDGIVALAAALGDAARLLAATIEELGDLATTDHPDHVVLDLDAAGRFVDLAPALLDELGIQLIGPEQLVRGGVAVRGRATPSPTGERPGAFSRHAVVDWRLVVTDDDGAADLSAAELARAEAAGATLLHTGRRWVRLDPEALRRARARLETHLRDHVEVGPAALARLAGENELEAAPADSPVRAWTDDLLAGLPDDRLSEVAEPPGFTGQLRPYQRRGLGWLQFLGRLGLGGCLADDMGLGKTATALAHLVERPGPHLVVCPLSVVHNWVAEAARFTPGMRVVVHHGPERAANGSDELAAADLVVTTYGLLPRDVAHLAATSWTTLVLDEAQAVKNPATRAAKAVRALTAGQKLALTGTPVENRLGELWAILDAVNPGLLGSREQFRQRFAKPIERDGDGEAAAQLRRITQPFVLRRSKADRQLLPELPDKIEQIAWAGLTREQSVLYQQVVDQLLHDAEAAKGMRRRGLILAALLRLKQICNHPAQALGDGSRLAGRSGKLARYDELVDELLDLGERALVFTQFREMGELLRRHAAERLELRVPFLHGGVGRNRRETMVAEFQAGAGPPLLLVSLKAGGTGLNLTSASQVIHYDRWWNPAVEDQATDRAWRMGQGRTVVVHKLVCEGTVEERIASMIDDKRALANAVIGPGESWLSELSTAELRQLVTLDTASTRGPV